VSSAPKLRFGIWFDFRNPPQWRRAYEDLYAETIEQVVWAEGLGYESAWLSEHHFAPDGYSPSPVVIAAALAVKTKRMRIGTNVLLLPLYHPVRLAEDCATVDILSRGRFELGVGSATGSMNSPATASLTRSAPDAPARVWRSSAVCGRGRPLRSTASTTTSRARGLSRRRCSGRARRFGSAE